MKYAVLFPGQGSQAVGMCADVRAQRPDLFGDAVNDLLGWDLNELIEHGPQERLTETQHAQPALYATSYGLYDEFASLVSTPPSAAAGHSLGEYTALAAAGAVSYLDGLALVAKRGEAMAACAASQSSGMAALLGTDRDHAEALSQQRRADGGQLYVANLNAPGQVVVAGGSEDIAWLVEHARDLGVRRAVALDVAGGFHSPFMVEAASALDEALRATEFAPPRFDVYANATAHPTTDVQQTLSDQLTATVRFDETLTGLAENGITTFVHVGPGDVTAGFAKRTVEGAEVKVVATIEQARLVADELSVQ